MLVPRDDPLIEGRAVASNRRDSDSAAGAALLASAPGIPTLIGHERVILDMCRRFRHLGVFHAPVETSPRLLTKAPRKGEEQTAEYQDEENIAAYDAEYLIWQERQIASRIV
jgi:hypothetical protein